ncbi:peptidyl-prolyl cis-trans isomerase [Flavobacterium chuncheonense]|uniref:Peptidyl-prolyl cis-trans isomerase n=1 Tax=Flavobacterium chuncheonense TaxID=2026653 RepID=A0ABW5YNZ2_9FLAO
MKKIFKEPLVHFMCLGFLIFGFYYLKNEDVASESKIVIDDDEYDFLVANWKNQWQREPNDTDIKAILDQYLRQEVFYNEALQLNLDHNDIIVKRRLAQKMEAVSNDLSEIIHPPTDAELEKFYNDNLQLFKLPPSYTFQQVLFLNSEPILDKEIATAKTLLTQENDIPNSRKLKLSLANFWEDTPLDEIDNTFGGDFATALEALPLDEWVGPIHSGFGTHLVYISKREASKIAPFHEAKPYIQKEFEYRTEIETQEKVYQDLLKKYRVQITSKNVPEAIKQTYNSL